MEMGIHPVHRHGVELLFKSSGCICFCENFLCEFMSRTRMSFCTVNMQRYNVCRS